MDYYKLDLAIERAERDLEDAKLFRMSALRALAEEYLRLARALEKQHQGLVYDFQRIYRMERDVDAKLESGQLGPKMRLVLEEEREKLLEAKKRLLEKIRAIQRQADYRTEQYIQASQAEREKFALDVVSV